MRQPPSYGGSRLLVCLMLSVCVTVFFFAYDLIAHHGTPVLSNSLNSATIVARPLAAPRASRFDELPIPDMNSADIKFAGADVAVEPLKPQIKLTVEPKQKARILNAKSHSSQPTRLAKVKIHFQGRAAYAQSSSPRFGKFSQF
jgi:hypothetical protein